MQAIKIIVLSNIVILGLVSNSALAYNCDNWVAKLQSVQGSVQVRQKNKQWLNVMRDATFCKGDVLRIQENSRAAIQLRNDTILRLSENTTITFTNLSPDKPSVVSIDTGIGHFISRVRAAFEVITPFINAAIEGTEFVVSVKEDAAEVTVFEGSVRAYNEHGEIRLTDNQTAHAKKGQAPVLIIKIKPRDAVSWSLYYPLILDEGKQNKTQSLNQLASQKLSIGHISEATKLLQKATLEDSNNSQTLALQAVISIVQNNKEQGLTLAQQAVAADTKNATAKLALSYAYQAYFKINDALQTLQQAAIDEPDNAIVLSRLAEVYLMHGELDKALSEAIKANTLNPYIGRTHTVLGFTYLTRIEIKQAITAFNNAIEKDQTDPLARLGLGLATIRQGDLTTGRREIEYASTLDPNNALIRSYLGKAYYEEKRNKLAAVQFKMAKELDPNDPTAYFYNAIRLQSENLNIQALQEMQQAIEKNNNRAVYSSNLKIEQDNASKNISQAQIYNDIGFEKEAQNLAHQSLQTDHGNHMAHRFLSESYATRPRHEIARVSEALQTLLYSPLSHNPVPPHISETNLGTLPNAGPSNNSFNTYNSLFEKNGSTWNINAIAGDQQTAGDEITYSVLQDNVAFSLGQYHYQTGGFRPNNDYQQDIVNLFFQTAINPNHSIQFEVKRNETESGDLRLRFDPNNYKANRRETDKTDSFRTGYHWKINNHSNWVTSLNIISRTFIRQEHSVAFAGAGPGGSDVILEDDRTEDYSAHNFETQYLYKRKQLTTLIGLGDYNNQYLENKRFVFTANGNILAGTPTTNNLYETQTNAYWYNYINLQASTITLGISNDDYNSNTGIGSSNQANYKLGLQYKITPAINIRLASFKNFTRSLTTSQTIEPTLVAGFNQIYDDQTASKTTNHAIGIDIKTKNNNSGLELIKRDLIIPGISNSKYFEEGQREYLHHAYSHFIWSNNITTGIEWLYEEFDKEITSNISNTTPSNLATHTMPLFISINAYNINTKFSMTYYDQDVTTPDSNQLLTTEHDSFWLGSLQLSYKLKKRAGQLKLNINNLFDQSFNYYDANFRTAGARAPTVSHRRSYTISINIPFD